MAISRHDGWWYRATREQRLAQIDAAIELGMNARQTAMCLGCLWVEKQNGASVADKEGGSRVNVFAQRNGRHFDGGLSVGARAHKADVQRVVNAKRIAAKRGNLIDSAFDIFGTNEPQSDSLFDEIPT